MKPIALLIPCDAQGCPDLQELVRLLGGYPEITPEDWQEFDRLTAAWHARRRDFAGQLGDGSHCQNGWEETP
jgi:hypothetical protein